MSCFDVLGRHLHPDGDAARQFPHTISKPSEVVRRGQVGERRRRNGGLSFGEPTDGGDLPLDLAAGQMASGPGLRRLPGLEVKRLNVGEQVFGVTELGRAQLEQVPGVGGVLFRQHPAFAGSNARARHLRTLGQGGLCLLGQSPEAHVGDEDRDFQPQGLPGIGTDHQFGADLDIFCQGLRRQLGRKDLDVIPLGKRRPWHAHRSHWAMMPGLVEPIPCQGVNELQGRLQGRVLGDRHAASLEG